MKTAGLKRKSTQWGNKPGILEKILHLEAKSSIHHLTQLCEFCRCGRVNWVMAIEPLRRLGYNPHWVDYLRFSIFCIFAYTERWMNSGAEASVTNDLVAVTQLGPNLWPPRQVSFKPCHTKPSWCSFCGAVILGQLSQGQPGFLRSPAKRETRAHKPCLCWQLWASVCNDSSLRPCFNKG